ncbi:cadherin-like domain-containing protein [Achromobacter sp. F4_2707]|uniref:cadherin-like domain-containing protein n=1 Tax=Achromobacter sp. F4_2707 TaxID=3114286 RepID=UPI0039C6B96F
MFLINNCLLSKKSDKQLVDVSFHQKIHNFSMVFVWPARACSILPGKTQWEWRCQVFLSLSVPLLNRYIVETLMTLRHRRRPSAPVTATRSAPQGATAINPAAKAAAFAPRLSRLALETRILFDGAAAVAADGAGEDPFFDAQPQSQQDDDKQQDNPLFDQGGDYVMADGEGQAGLNGQEDDNIIEDPLDAGDSDASGDVVAAGDGVGAPEAPVGEALKEEGEGGDLNGGFQPFSMTPMSTGDVNITVTLANEDPLQVSEPSDLNEEGAHVVDLTGWVLSGDDGTYTVTVKVQEESGITGPSGSIIEESGFTGTFTGTKAEIQSWLNSLSFQANDIELGSAARTVTIAVMAGEQELATREVVITPSNDPVKVVRNPEDEGVTLTINEGRDENGNFTAPQVLKWEINDPEVEAGAQIAEQIVYNLQEAPEHGYLTLNGGRLGVGSIFTHEDVESGRVKYVHEKTGADQNTPDTFKLRVNDGATPIGDSDVVEFTLEFTPINQLPTVSGGGVVYEHQPTNAKDTGSVGSYIQGNTGGDPGDDLNDALVQLTSLSEDDKGGTLWFTGTALIDGDEQYIDRALTASDLSGAGFFFKYASREGLRYEHDGREGDHSDSFKVKIFDGGGEGDSSEEATITLEIRPIDDDPVLGYEDGNGVIQEPTLEATVLAGEVGDPVDTNAVTLTKEVISATDVDTPPERLSFVVDYSASDMEHGQLQLKVGGTWWNLPSGSSFTMRDVEEGNVRYVQYDSADDAAETDTFFFRVIDNTTAMRWDNNGDPYDRIGGIYVDPEIQGSELDRHEFVINLKEFTGTGTGAEPLKNLNRDATEEALNAGKPTVEVSTTVAGEVKEGESIQIWGSKSDDEAEERPYISYEITGIEKDQITYTFMGFDADKGHPDAGYLTKGSVTLNKYDTFTQADLDAGLIRFVHHGGEKFFTSALFNVSAGTTELVNDEIVQQVWNQKLDFYITPVNDAPVVTGSDSQVIKEGETVYITPDILNVSDPDDDTSLVPDYTAPDIDSNETIDESHNYAVDHDDSKPLTFKVQDLPENGGVLEYWNGSGWVPVTAETVLNANLLKGGPEGYASGLRFVHDGSEVREFKFGVVATDRWGQDSGDAAEVRIQITNVNDAPLIPKTPGDTTTKAGEDPNQIGDDIKNKAITVYEGGKQGITIEFLQAYDSDSTEKQVQYTITEATKYGDLMLNGAKLGAGSSFTQKDITDGKLSYVHRGGEENAASENYDDHFKFTLSDGDLEQTGNEFWIHVRPTNDAPTVEVPTGPIKPDDLGVNVINGIKVDDPDLKDIDTVHEKDFVQVTVRLKDGVGTVQTTGFTFEPNNPAAGVLISNEDGLLVLQGTREQVNNALDGLKVEFSEDKNLKYTLEIIADDRLRNTDGSLKVDGGGNQTANGGDKNQPEQPGGALGEINFNEYEWTTESVPTDHGNITSKTIEIWSSLENDPPVLEVPSDIIKVYEDVLSHIDLGTSFELSDVESAAFDTPVTLTITLKGDASVSEFGKLQISNANLPSGSIGGVTIIGQGGASLALVGKASDIEALLKASGNSGGLYYTSPGDVNHDLNGEDGTNGDITINFSLDDNVGSTSGSGSDLGKEPEEGSREEKAVHLKIVAVNDAPTVTAPTGEDSGILTIDSADWTPAGDFRLADVDANDGYATGEKDGIIQVTVRVLGADGTPLNLEAYGTSGISFQSTTADHGAESDGTLNGSNSALRIYGTLEQVQAYLDGLQVRFANAMQSNLDGGFKLEVIVDDRLYEKNGADWVLTKGGDGKPLANGGAVNQNGTATPQEISDKQSLNVYTDKVAGYDVFNIDNATRDLFISSINDPAEIGIGGVYDADIKTLSAVETGDTKTVTLTGLTIADSDAQPNDILDITIAVPEGFTFATPPENSPVSGDGKTITLSGTLTQINGWMSSVTINLPDTDAPGAGAREQDWNGSFDFTVTVNDRGNTGVTPETAPDGKNGNGFTIGVYDGKPAIVTTRTLTFTVAPTNDAPLVTLPEGKTEAKETLAPVDEDFSNTAAPTPGTTPTVETLFSKYFDDSRDAINNNSNGDIGAVDGTDSDSFWGVAVIGNAADTDNQGKWQYWNGTSWADIPTTVGDGTALLLSKDTAIQFLPSKDWNGTPGELTVRLVEDNTNNDTTSTTTTMTSGTTVNITSGGGFGGTSLYSEVTVKLATSVTAINDAPTIKPGVTIPAIPVIEDATAPEGNKVNDLFGSSFEDVTDTVAGGSSSNEFAGVAIVGVDSSNGTWQYDDGTGWKNLPTDIAEGNAFILKPTDELRFIPNPDYNGTPDASVSVRLIDNSVAVPDSGTSVDLTGDKSGGTTPYSEQSVKLTVTVEPVNDAPTLTVGGKTEGIEVTPAETEGTTGDAFEVSLLEDTVVVTDIDLSTTSNLGNDVFGDGEITVQLTGFITGDVLRLASMPGMDGQASYDDASGKLTINLLPTATITEVQNILSAIKYAHTTQDPTNIKGEDGTPVPRDSLTFTVTLSDGNNQQSGGHAGGPKPLSAEVSGTINLIADNDPPVAVHDANSLTNLQNSVTGNLIFGTGKNGGGTDITPNTPDSDPDTPTDQLKIINIEVKTPGHGNTTPSRPIAGDGGDVKINGKYGTLTIHPDGTYTYELDHDNEDVFSHTSGTLTETFEYTLTDRENPGDDDKVRANLVITINGATPSAPTITPKDGNAAGDADGHNTVYEKGLPTGSVGDNSHSVDGVIDLKTDSGLVSVAITGKDGTTLELTLAQLKGATPASPIEIVTEHGTLKITGLNVIGGTENSPRTAEVLYTYTLNEAVENAVPGNAGDENHTDSIALSVKQNGDLTGSGTLNIFIVDDAPTANNDSNTMTVQQPNVAGNVFDNDTIGADGYPSGDPAVKNPVTGVTGGDPQGDGSWKVTGEYGELHIHRDGSYTYTPDKDKLANDRATDSWEENFNYTITDADDDPATAKLTITITNEAPVANPDNHRVTPDTPATGNILTNDNDPDGPDKDLKITGFEFEVPGLDEDGNPTTKTVSGNPGDEIDIDGVGKITINKDGSYLFIPEDGWQGTVPPITYTVEDPYGATSTSTLTITVAPDPVPAPPPTDDFFRHPEPPPPGTPVVGGPPPLIRGTTPPSFGLYNTPTGEVRSPVTGDQVRDVSVFFDGSVYNKVPRVPLPFHPIVYVNREVQAAQDERAETDARSMSNTFWSQPGMVGSSSIGAGLGQDPNLFVEHAVRMAQRGGDMIDNLVLGRLGRVGLGADGALPVPDLSEPVMRGVAPAVQPPAAQPPAEPAANEAPENTSAQDEVAQGVSSAFMEADELAAEDDAALQLSHAAPSFSEQLRGGSGRLPVVLQAPKDLS